MYSSVPRWPTADPGVDETGRAFGIVAVDAPGRRVAESWAGRIHALGRPLDLWFGADAPLAEWLDRARVGYRLMLAGPEADLLTLRAAAGVLLDAELTLLVTDRTERPVWCAHCGTTGRAAGAALRCPGCGRELAVHDHTSRAHGTYLGSTA
jgi:dimethylamine monooxygenase subunit C